MALPVVVIIGRPNVGKSTLFNRLAGRMISIVDPQPGVTRDRLSTVCQVGESADGEEGGKYFELVDTGGYGIEDLDTIGPQVERQIGYALERAGLILFLVDAHTGINPLDRQLAKILRRLEKPMIPVANKVDNDRLRVEASEMLRLGFDNIECISAAHGYGISDLLDVIGQRLSTTEPAPAEPVMKFAIVGPRNAGKSTFINALAGEDRVIVSEIPGTTRDAVDVRFELDGKTFLAIDTAGVRKKRQIRDSIEFYGMARAERSIRRADVILLMLDASESVGQVTKKLAGYIIENYKPCLIAVNKWDLAAGRADIEDYGQYLGKQLPGLTFAPISLTCARDGTNVDQTVKLAMKLFEQASTRVSTGKLNAVVETIRKQRPPSASRAKGYPRFYYATQIDTHPPTIVLFVNDRAAYTPTYQRFVINRFRELLPFEEIPIRLLIRERTRKGFVISDSKTKDRKRETDNRKSKS